MSHASSPSKSRHTPPESCPVGDRPTLPCALSIAGLDPSGGAGLLADVRAFLATGAWGCGVAAVLTEQSTAQMKRAFAVPTPQVLAQARGVLATQSIRAVKVGALGSVENVRGIARLMGRSAGSIPWVIDPVMLPTHGARGARLLDLDAQRGIFKLIERATVVTPNAAEAECLTGIRVRSLDEAARAGEHLVSLGAQSALIKGGHWGGRIAVDLLVFRGGTRAFRAIRRDGAQLHGTGCTLSALIAGFLAVEGGELHPASPAERIALAVGAARKVLLRAIDRPISIGPGDAVLAPRRSRNSFAKPA